MHLFGGLVTLSGISGVDKLGAVKDNPLDQA